MRDEPLKGRVVNGSYRPAIAYSKVGTGRTPSAVPSSSKFPVSHLGSECGLIARSYRAFSFSATRTTYTMDFFFIVLFEKEHKKKVFSVRFFFFEIGSGAYR
jgi:hypothetical protein